VQLAYSVCWVQEQQQQACTQSRISASPCRTGTNLAQDPHPKAGTDCRLWDTAEVQVCSNPMRRQHCSTPPPKYDVSADTLNPRRSHPPTHPFPPLVPPLPHLWDLAEVQVCGHTVDDCVAAGRCHKLHAVAAWLVQGASPVVDLHTCDDGIVGLAGVNRLANQLLKVLQGSQQ
jgi:hypothetical protein